jgi:cell wall-associated NlpC family hydrolase
MSDGYIVAAAIAPLNAEPRAGSEQVSQALAGHALEALETQGAWIRVGTADAYAGWMHQGYVRALGARERAKRYATGRVSLGCTVAEIDGRRRALPLGAILSDDAFVESGAALTPGEMVARFPRTPGSITRTALHFFEGTAYEWGGVTPWGADCSGLVQTTFALHGIRLPRDARMQAELGSDLGSDLGALHAADLLFFSDRDDGRITHVALALDRDRIVHSALGRGGYAVEHLGRTDDPYVSGLRERFRFARRIDL